jgi:pimeloyl-ACP methyl ester carboxylesterase
VINTSSRIGRFAIINTGASVDHDNLIKDGVHISPGCHLAGNVISREDAFIVITPRCQIGTRAAIGAGAAVISDIAPDVLGSRMSCGYQEVSHLITYTYNLAGLLDCNPGMNKRLVADAGSMALGLPWRRARGKAMAAGKGWSESVVEVAGAKLHLARGGSGPPVLVLHHDIGSPDQLPFYDALASRFDVLVPHHPGYGRSERPEWLRNVRDLAVIHQWLLADLEVERPSLIGLGFGGWIAAEMATMAPREFHRLILVGAMGVKPPEGDIFDQAIVSYIDYARAGFHDQDAFARVYGEVSTDQLVEWDLCREMSFRIAWKPYMYNQSLPHLLGGVRAPALVVWGDDDKIVPRSAGEQYAALLPNARFELVRACGHCVEMEQPDRLAGLVREFVEEN